MTGALRDTIRRFREQDLGDRAAALTYYAVLSIFPALIVLLSVLGLIGTSATRPLLDNLDQLAPGPATDVVRNAIRELNSSQGASGALFVLGLLLALWSASGHIGAFVRASNEIYGVEESRPFWKLRPFQLAMTMAILLVLALGALISVFSGDLAREAGKVFGVGGAAVAVWNVAKWPVWILIGGCTFSVLFRTAPNLRNPGVGWVSPGVLLAVIVWGLASAAFSLYVSHFGSYNKTYGSLGGVVVFLVWLWISNAALLLGVVLNAELRQRRLGAQPHTGGPAAVGAGRQSGVLSQRGSTA